MECKNCKNIMDSEFCVEESMHDDDSLEVSTSCDKCGQYHYAFIEIMDFQISGDTNHD